MIDDEPEKSRYQQVMDDIIQNQIEARKKLAEHLMVNPGFLSTFGPDFFMEFGSIELETHTPIEVSPLEEVHVRISQEIRFRRNTENN